MQYQPGFDFAKLNPPFDRVRASLLAVFLALKVTIAPNANIRHESHFDLMFAG